MNMKAKKRLIKIVLYVLQITASIIFIVPLLWMVEASFKPENEIFKNVGSLKGFLISNFTLQNYHEMLIRIPFMGYILNSFIYIGVIVVLGIIVNSLAGYALAKLHFPGSKIILLVIIGLYIVPFETVLLPLYLITNKLGLINHYSALYLPFIAECFNIFLFRQFFIGFPVELEEAAEIDGASPLKTFIKIVLPNSKPVIATSAVLTIVGHWGDFMWPLMVTTDDSLRTVQVGIQLFFTDPPVHYGPIMAALTFTTLPMIIIFLALQRYYVQGITSTGLKG
ncbi:ABC-type sugar transport system, permease component [Clostridium pasteurianum BC1]|uniref:ABC-type sugar transport system, permease component n=2 Tax=Clostridium pasteurianum TaxID=1501 RepID=R4KDX8_CLOPA|nr:ABC-type sugar transport system, permease component [Clostridium pasteurianum BC1]